MQHPKPSKVRSHSPRWYWGVHDKDRVAEEPCAPKWRKHGFGAEVVGVIPPSTVTRHLTVEKSGGPLQGRQRAGWRGSAAPSGRRGRIAQCREPIGRRVG